MWHARKLLEFRQQRQRKGADVDGRGLCDARKFEGSTDRNVHEREQCEDVGRESFLFFFLVSLHDEFDTSVSLASFFFRFAFVALLMF